jgi:hypothetical protein
VTWDDRSLLDGCDAADVAGPSGLLAKTGTGSWPVERRDAALLDLRAARFGPRLALLAACPACGEQIEAALEVADVRPVERALAADGRTFRSPALDDLRDAAACADPGEARALLTTRCLVSGDPDGAAEAFAAALAAAERLVGLACPTCEATSEAPFDAGAFVLAEARAEAGRIIDEVHELAVAYGWTEADVLALSPRRRSSYLRLVRG